MAATNCPCVVLFMVYQLKHLGTEDGDSEENACLMCLSSVPKQKSTWADTKEVISFLINEVLTIRHLNNAPPCAIATLTDSICQTFRRTS